MGNLAVHRLLLDKHTHIIHFLLWQVLIQFILCLFLRLHTHNCSLLTLSAITHPRNFGTRGRVCQRPSLDLGMGPWVLFKSFISFWLTMVWSENQLLVDSHWGRLAAIWGHKARFFLSLVAHLPFSTSPVTFCFDCGGNVLMEVLGLRSSGHDIMMKTKKSSCSWLSCPVSICTMTKPMKRLRWIWIEEWPTQIFASP